MKWMIVALVLVVVAPVYAESKSVWPGVTVMKGE